MPFTLELLFVLLTRAIQSNSVQFDSIPFNSIQAIVAAAAAMRFTFEVDKMRDFSEFDG